MAYGMTETALYVWRNSERGVFDYLLTVTGGVENDTAYLAELPKAMPATSGVKVWSFHINGSNEEQMKPRPFWRFTAMLDGFFTERLEAQRLAGKIMEATPIIEGAITGVRLVRILGWSLTRGTRALDEDLSQGGDSRMWMLEMQLEVVAVNSTPEI